jgi:THO complex subunit 5
MGHASCASLDALRSAGTELAEAQDTRAAEQGWLAILELKARSRELYEGLEAQRQRTAEAKAALERTLLQLQNLQYEKAHYEKEIRTCRGFNSAFTDAQIGLAGEQDFLSRAPPEFTRPAEAPGLERHTRMLNRLAFEAAERKELAARLASLKVHRKALQETITSRRTLVLAMSTELKAVRCACAPLAKLIAGADKSLVPLLPAPLKHLFASLDGAAGVKRRFQVSVFGSPELVASEPSGEVSGRHTKKGDGEEEEEAAPERRRAEPGDAVHPLSVCLELFALDDATRLMAIRFEVAQQRGALLVRMEQGDPAVLRTGAVLGEELVEHEAGEAEAEEAPQPGAPRWAQQLAEATDVARAAAIITALFEAAEETTQMDL